LLGVGRKADNLLRKKYCYEIQKKTMGGLSEI